MFLSSFGFSPLGMAKPSRGFQVVRKVDMAKRVLVLTNESMLDPPWPTLQCFGGWSS